MKTFFKYFLIIIFATSFVFSQTDETIICKFCKTKNKTNYTFCINCGKSLSTTKQSKDTNPLTTHKLDHLFSIPKAEMLKSLDVNFMLGGAWGLEEQNSFLGSFALGLGDVAQIEVGTIGMIGNLLGLSNISTIGLKGIIFQENEKLPSIALSLRSSNDWDYNSLSENEVQANSPRDYASGLRDYNYEMRFTSLSLILSKNVGDKNSLHFGASYMDTRYRNLYRYIYNNPFLPTPISGEFQKDLFGFFGGIEHIANERTVFMIEVQSFPSFRYNINSASIETSKMFVTVAGVRFAVLEWLVIDTGARYQSNFKGLADVQIRLSANAIFSISK